MRRTEEPIDPEITAALDAIDATLAGEPVDPRHAELAELALLLTADRPEVEPAFASRLDERVARRFAAAAGVPASGPAGSAAGGGPRMRAPRHWMGWTAGLATAGVAAVVTVVVLGSGGSGGTSHLIGAPQAADSGRPATTSTTAASAATSSASAGIGSASARSSRSAAAASSSVKPANPTVLGPQLGAVRSAAPAPPPNGRKIIQSAQLALTTGASHVDDVAQEVFDVVGRENGIVNNSSITAGSPGYAQFRLSIPSGNLTQTMSALSQLRFAHVSSRTDTTQDVNGQYISAGRRLADDRALRTSLLKQLANATTQIQIDSLKQQLHDAEVAIAHDEAAVRSLNARINYSQVLVTIDSGITPVPVHHSSKGFTLGKAAHDAGRVLTVAAGVALITLAAMVPVLLIAALGWWIATAVRRRRREQALDLA